MQRIGLIATSIDFTLHSIVYGVRFSIDGNFSGAVFCNNDIKHKDLVLKPTFVCSENMEVIFTAVNVTPHFYQQIHKKIIRDLSEYEVEKRNIYDIGEIVGYIVFENPAPKRKSKVSSNPLQTKLEV